jgi:hypothetical protein
MELAFSYGRSEDEDKLRTSLKVKLHEAGIAGIRGTEASQRQHTGN